MSFLSFTVIGGGGKVALHFTRLAVQAGHTVHSVIKDDGHAEEIQSLGAKAHILSLEHDSPQDFASLFTSTTPDVVFFAAGSGGKPPGPEVIDFKGAVKVFDAMEMAKVKRLVYIGSVDIRSREKPAPEWYDEKDRAMSDRVWSGIGAYMQAKLNAELNLHTRSAIDYTVLRPANLTQEPAGGVQLGRTHITQTSRELVAQLALVASTTPGTETLSIDVIDGEGKLDAELRKVVEKKLDSWIG